MTNISATSGQTAPLAEMSKREPSPCAQPLAEIRRRRPLIHCITNPISINDCANAVLAVGGRPIMAEHPREAAEITAGADALVLNIGNITDARMESIRISLEAACEKGIPSVFDMVGVGCSSLRLSYVRELFQKNLPTVLKGNRSEWKVFLGLEDRVNGVDVSEADAAEAGLEAGVDDAPDAAEAQSENPNPAVRPEPSAAAVKERPAFRTVQSDVFLSALTDWALKNGTVALVSGERDWITDGKALASVRNGSPFLSQLTGTGCMQGVLVGSFLAVEEAFKDFARHPDGVRQKPSTGQSAAFAATVSGAVLLGEAGEMAAAAAKGPGSFHMGLFDALSAIDGEGLKNKAKVEYEEL